MPTQKKWKFPKDAAAFRLESRKAWDHDKVEPLRRAMALYEEGSVTYEQLVAALARALPSLGEVIRIQNILSRPWWRFW